MPEDDLQFPAEIRSVPVEKGCGRTPSWRLLLIRLDFTGCLLCAEKVGGGVPLDEAPRVHCGFACIWRRDSGTSESWYFRTRLENRER